MVIHPVIIVKSLLDSTVCFWCFLVAITLSVYFCFCAFLLINFMLLVSFYIPQKHQVASDFFLLKCQPMRGWKERININHCTNQCNFLCLLRRNKFLLSRMDCFLKSWQSVYLITWDFSSKLYNTNLRVN